MQIRTGPGLRLRPFIFAEALSSPIANPPLILERDVPFSQSLLWSRQRQAYIDREMKAWTEDRIPNFITNNPFIAEVYTRLVAAFIADCGPLAAPLHILEIGGGVGKFAFLFLRQLQEQLAASGVELDRVRYTLADCSPAVVEALQGNAYLRQFAERGILDFHLACDQLPPSWLAASAGKPRVLIANYVFDSLPHDAFQFQAGQIFEFRLTTSADDPATPVRRLHLAFETAPVQAHRYPNADWNQILRQYGAQLPQATVLFPAGPLRLLEPLLSADDPLLVLVGDKGFVHGESLALLQGPPALEFHSQDHFSVMANLDAIAQYFRLQGGAPLLPEKFFSTFSVCGFLHGGEGEFPATTAAYAESRDGFGADDLFTLMSWMNAYLDKMSPPEILATLRLTRWDPIAFWRLFPALARQIGGAAALRNDLREAVRRCWQNHFPVTAEENQVPFACGVVLLGLGFAAEAVPLFQASNQSFGPSAATSYNLALCYQALNDLAAALANVREARRLDPEYQPARTLLQQLSPSEP